MAAISTRFRLPTTMLTLLLLVMLACGSLIAMPGDPDATATAQVRERLPTLEAQMTAFALQIEESGTLTPISPDLIVMETPTGDSSGAPTSTLAPGTDLPPAANGDGDTVLPTSAAGASLEGAYDGGDGWPTLLLEPIAYGQTVTQTIQNAEAHNWLLSGQTGQQVRIEVASDGESDIRLKLIDPNGVKIQEVDGTGQGGNEALEYTLSATGTYTIRIDMWFGGGGYTLSVSRG